MQNQPPQSSTSKIIQSQRAWAHEARNQLSVIIGCADLLLNDRKNMKDEKIDALLKEIQHASEHLNLYIQGLSHSKDKGD
jgi:K+-sensing histidine kinase KdpD